MARSRNCGRCKARTAGTLSVRTPAAASRSWKAAWTRASGSARCLAWTRTSCTASPRCGRGGAVLAVSPVMVLTRARAGATFLRAPRWPGPRRRNGAGGAVHLPRQPVAVVVVGAGAPDGAAVAAVFVRPGVLNCADAKCTCKRYTRPLLYSHYLHALDAVALPRASPTRASPPTPAQSAWTAPRRWPANRRRWPGRAPTAARP